MEFPLEFFASILIICVFILTFYVNKLKSNAEFKDANLASLNAQLTKDSSSYLLREEKLHNNITQLQETLNREQSLIKNREEGLDRQEKAHTDKIKALEESLEQEIDSRKKILSQKKSSEVRIGNIAEKMAPFLDDFEFDPETCIFLGQPIDYLSFGDDGVTFIEVKSGKSQLSSKQRHIRDLIKAKQVSWKEFRIQ